MSIIMKTVDVVVDHDYGSGCVEMIMEMGEDMDVVKDEVIILQYKCSSEGECL